MFCTRIGLAGFQGKEDVKTLSLFAQKEEMSCPSRRFGSSPHHAVGAQGFYAALSDEINARASEIAEAEFIPGNSGAVMKFDTPDGQRIRVGCSDSEDDLPISTMVRRHKRPPSSQEERRKARRAGSKSKSPKKAATARPSTKASPRPRKKRSKTKPEL